MQTSETEQYSSFRFLEWAIAAIVLLFAGPAIAGTAGPELVGTSAGAPPGTHGVFVTFDYLGNGSGVTSGRFRLQLGSANSLLLISELTCRAPIQCPASLDEDFVFASTDGAEVADLSEAVRVTFDIDPAAPTALSETIEVRDEQYRDAIGNSVQPGTSIDSIVSLLAGPGSGLLEVRPPNLVIVGSINGPPAEAEIVIANDGPVGDLPMNVSCQLGPVTGGGSITVDNFNGTLLSGESATVLARCSGGLLGTLTATYTCDREGFGQKNDSTEISCIVSNALPNPDPPAGTTASLFFGSLLPGESSLRTVTFQETNALPVLTYDVTCQLLRNDQGAFSFVGANSGTVPGGGTLEIVISGTRPASGVPPSGELSCTYSNGAAGTVTFTLGIGLRPQAIPTVFPFGILVLIMSLLGYGALRLRA